MPVRKPQREKVLFGLLKRLWSDPPQGLKDLRIKPCFQDGHLQSKFRKRLVLPNRFLLGRVKATVVQPNRRIGESEVSFLNAPLNHLLIFAVEYEKTVLVHDFKIVWRS